MKLSLEQISKTIFRYMKQNHVDLLTAYEQVDKVLKIDYFTYEEVKNYLFSNGTLLLNK